MSIVLEPSTQLGFNRPLTQLVKKSLTVKNHNAQPVAFKVKTTAPKLYCVRPNSGRIDPGQSVEVQVLLQPMKEEPPINAKCKDKFLVQSIFIAPEHETRNLADVWAAPSPDAIHQQKIKVVYLPTEGSVPEEEPGHDMSILNQSAFTNAEDFGTVRGAPSTSTRPNMVDSFVPVHREDARTPTPENAHQPAGGEYIIAHEETTQHETHYGEPSSARDRTSQHVPPSPSPVPLSAASSQLNEQYREAQEEISRLKQLVASLQESGMRRRNKPVSDDGASSYTGDGETVDGASVIDQGGFQTESGVPLQVVIIIALGVFTLTYLFF